MAVAIKMPDLGTAVDEIRLVKWLVREGDTVRRGDLLAEIETDKASSELESVAEGVVLKLVMEEGAAAGNGSVIAFVGSAGEPVPADGAQPPAHPPPAEAHRAQAATAPAVPPMLRNLAAKHGVDLALVHGTGPRGAVTREDVLRAAQGNTGQPLSRGQLAVARAVSRSAQEIPHIRLYAALDMTAANAMRARAKNSGWRLGYEALFLKAMAEALEAVPVMAARLEGERLVAPDGTHLGLALSTGDDLFLPIVRNVDRKDVRAVQAEIDALASQAAGGGLPLDSMAGASMSLSNLGMYPVESFDAVIFPGQSGILAVGAVSDKAVVAEGQLAVRPMVTVCLAADHRYVNGRTAAEFLTALKRVIETERSM